MRHGFFDPQEADDRRQPAMAAPASFEAFAVFVGLYLSAALVLGGSSTMLVPAAALQLAALPLLTAALIRLAWQGGDRALIWPLALAGAAVILPLIQLIPLPHDFWAGLPGRRAVDESLRLAGLPGRRMPLSLSPSATWASEFGLWPPLAMFAAGLSLRDGSRRVLAACIVLAALASVALAVSQKLGGEGRAIFGIIDLSAKGGASGFFSNRNHQASLLCAAIPLASLVTTGRWTTAWPMRLATCVGVVLVLLAGALVTTSRAALVLAPIAVVFAAGIASLQLTRREGGLFAVTPLVGLAGVCALVLALAMASGFAPLADRFQSGLGEDLRFALFPIVARAGLEFAPMGTGLGTFAGVYQSVEPAALIGPAFVNHAHNDYLELWLEGGLAAVAVMIGFLAWWAIGTMRLRGVRSPGLQATGLAGSAVVALILMHSAIDYPVRTPAIACLLGFACALIVRRGEGAAQAPSVALRHGGPIPAVVAAVVLLPLVGVGGWICFKQAASGYYEAADPARALRWKGDNPTALANRAEAEFGRSTSDPQARANASNLARAAIAASPIEARPYRILALTAEASGQATEVRPLMAASNQWSRRDELTQVWLMLDDLERQKFADAMLRADLVLKQWWQLESVVFPAIQEKLGLPQARADLVAALATSPQWRPGFLRVLAASQDDPALVQSVFRDLRKTARPPTADEVEHLIARLMSAGAYRVAYEEWAREPGIGGTGGIYDGDFRGLPGGAPFNWRFSSASGQGVRPLVLDDGASALAVTAGAGGGAVLAEQTVILPPGDYTIRGRARGGGADEQPAAAFEWRLTCLPQGGEIIRQAVIAGPGAAWRDFAFAVQVPAACQAQVLQLLGPAGGGSSEAYFRGLSAQPTAQSAAAP